MSAEFGPLAESVFRARYSWDGQESWSETSQRVAIEVMSAIGYHGLHPDTQKIAEYINQRKFLPGGRYLASSGREYHQVQNCLLLRAEDTTEGWGELLNKVAVALMRGAGVGVDYSALRPRGSKVSKTGHKAGGPCALMKAVNEVGRQMKEGDRLAAIWAGLSWNHPDVMEFITIKDHSEALRQLKEKDHSIPLQMEYTNVSVILDDLFFEAYQDKNHPQHDMAHFVYWATVKRMFKTAEPGFSVNVGKDSGETLRNACTEVTSSDDSDVCNLGSINLGKVESLSEFADIVKYATLFLLAGTVYSDLPYKEVADTREKNRRLGLGVMGVHEWLLKRGKSYAPDTDLAQWMSEYKKSTIYAHQWADSLNLSRPVKTRAIAPTGTIGIIAETTTGIEPVFCVAYQRRWKDSEGTWSRENVVDPTAERLIESGIHPDDIEDAYSIPFERRLAMQAWLQQFVDHGISSTVNLPHPVVMPVKVKELGDVLMKYLPELRGVTVYPDGARSGQPITPLKYSELVEHNPYEDEFKCSGNICSI